MSRVAAAMIAAGLALAPLVGPAAAHQQARKQAQTGWEIVILGIAQDAGIPQLGCTQALCESIREGKRKPERVSSIGLRNTALGATYLFDATPDFVSQVASLGAANTPTAIFLTHGHIGHYTGLMYLGRESIDANGVPVYGTARMAKYLETNGPWSQLVTRNNIELRTVTSGRPVDLDHGIFVTALTVPHRDEFTDTVGYLIEGPSKKALFIPDIDRWEKWDRSIHDMANTVDYLFVDGTFASADEIPGRAIDDIPHPLMPATRALLKGTRAALWFIHINHTNREIDAPDVVRDGMRFPF